jgi:hypothetical protein
MKHFDRAIAALRAAIPTELSVQLDDTDNSLYINGYCFRLFEEARTILAHLHYWRSPAFEHATLDEFLINYVNKPFYVVSSSNGTLTYDKNNNLILQNTSQDSIAVTIARCMLSKISNGICEIDDQDNIFLHWDLSGESLKSKHYSEKARAYMKMLTIYQSTCFIYLYYTDYRLKNHATCVGYDPNDPTTDFDKVLSAFI